MKRMCESRGNRRDPKKNRNICNIINGPIDGGTPTKENLPNNNASPIYSYSTLVSVPKKHARSVETSIDTPGVVEVYENTAISPTSSCIRTIGRRMTRTRRSRPDIA